MWHGTATGETPGRAGAVNSEQSRLRSSLETGTQESPRQVIRELHTPGPSAHLEEPKGGHDLNAHQQMNE